MLKAAVLGLGRFGASTALALCESGAEVLAVDKNERLVNQVAADVTVAVADGGNGSSVRGKKHPVRWGNPLQSTDSISVCRTS